MTTTTLSPGATIDLPPPYSSLPRRAAVWGLDPKAWKPHRIHSADANRVWLETNCYVDVWAEVLWAMGIDCTSAFAFTLGVDFEGDQWTFFKFPLADLQRLYGVDTQELSLWKSLHLHALEQVSRGRVVLMEMDSYFLPDTSGTAYQREHVKTTIGIESMDLDAHRMGYFHNQSYHAVEGADFDHLFRLEDPWTPQSARLLPYTEFVKKDGLVNRAPDDLVKEALALAGGHLRRGPASNPFARYRSRLTSDLDWLRTQPAEHFHQYAFVSVRQFGANYELASDFCKWVASHGPSYEGFLAPAAEFEAIANEARTLQFKIARMVTLKRPLDANPLIDGLAARWDTARAALLRLLP